MSTSAFASAAFEQVLARPPSDAEIAASLAFLARQVKLFADGAIISQLMQMREPYLDDAGQPIVSHDEQADPTVQYALPNHVDRVLFKDLEIESKYNTYKYAGLPPGLDSIARACRWRA